MRLRGARRFATVLLHPDAMVSRARRSPDVFRVTRERITWFFARKNRANYLIITDLD